MRRTQMAFVEQSLCLALPSNLAVALARGERNLPHLVAESQRPCNGAIPLLGADKAIRTSASTEESLDLRQIWEGYVPSGYSTAKVHTQRARRETP